ncbi:hypothetical protein IPA_06800 [Ignicoccus pacificus DSM 13166]|uniref:TIGR00725 family protein n=1 Tax=Ignicoccus pacificus DSM 13166 TaxID=940294 RepID=A0A977KB79_9CREN|nr:hypothetical protein IPA_06800 [Ignicoccus pacificus DSM 13166]
MRVAVAACGCEGPEELGKRVALGAKELGLELALGGCWGLMGSVVRNALKEGVEVTVFLPAGAECIYNAKIIKTNMTPNMRSVLLVTSSDALLALGGGAGTVMEVFMAYRERKPVALIKGYGMDSDKYFEIMKDGVDSRGLSPVKAFEDPLEALRWLRGMV